MPTYAFVQETRVSEPRTYLMEHDRDMGPEDLKEFVIGALREGYRIEEAKGGGPGVTHVDAMYYVPTLLAGMYGFRESSSPAATPAAECHY